jgi:hypothetical protein
MPKARPPFPNPAVWDKVLRAIHRLERRVMVLEAQPPLPPGAKVYNDSADPPRRHKSTRSAVRKG